MADKRVAVVTGSSSGIGAAVARRLAAAGCRVVVNSVRSAEAGRALAEALPEAIYVQADVAVEEQAKMLIDTAVRTFGRLDILVNNAGTTRRIAHHDLAAATPEIWREILGVNVIGTWQATVAAVPHLHATGSGCIVNVSSIAGQRTSGSSIPYAVSKAAVDHLTRLLANVLGPQIRVNAVAPGLIDTPWIAGMDEFAERIRQTTPLRRVGAPEDVAEVVAGLVAATYVTGEVVVVDGGLHLA
jgi:ketoreductase RED2